MSTFMRMSRLIFLIIIVSTAVSAASLLAASCVNKATNKAAVCIVSGPKRQRASEPSGIEIWTNNSSGNNPRLIANLGEIAGEWNVSRHSFVTENSLPLFSGRSSKERKTALLDLKTGQLNEAIEEWGIVLFPQRFFGETDRVAVQMIDETKTPKEHYPALWNSETKLLERISFPAIDDTLGAGRFITGLGGWGDTLSMLVKEEKRGVGGPGGRVSQWHLYIFDLVSKTKLAEYVFDFTTDNADAVSIPLKVGEKNRKDIEPEPKPNQSTEANINTPIEIAPNESDKLTKDDITNPTDSKSPPASNPQTSAETTIDGEIVERFLVSIADFSFVRPPDADGNVVLAYNTVLYDTLGEPDGTRLGGSKPVILKLNISTGKSEQMALPDFVKIDTDRPNIWVTRYTFYDAKTNSSYIQFRSGRGGAQAVHPIAALNADLSWKLAAETTDRYAWFATAADGSLWYTDTVMLDEPQVKDDKADTKTQANAPDPQSIGKAVYRIDPKGGNKRIVYKAQEIMALFVIH